MMGNAPSTSKDEAKTKSSSTIDWRGAFSGFGASKSTKNGDSVNSSLSNGNQWFPNASTNTSEENNSSRSTSAKDTIRFGDSTTTNDTATANSKDKNDTTATSNNNFNPFTPFEFSTSKTGNAGTVKTFGNQLQGVDVSSDCNEKEDAPNFDGYTVNQILREWETNLEDHVDDFIEHSEQIRHIDEKMLDNQTDIRAEKRRFINLVVSKNEFDSNLEKIKAQQDNLGAIIESLERNLNSTSSLGVDSIEQALSRSFEAENEKNVKRESVYGLAETIDQNLNSLNERLMAKIEELNRSQQAFNKHQLTPVVDILNDHLESLNWIDDQTDVITQRLDQMQGHSNKG